MVMEKIKVCITGADGFVGRHLIKKLKKENKIKAVIFSGDLNDKKNVDNFFRKHRNIDQVIHLAGLFFGDFEELLDANVRTTQNLMEAGAKYGVKKIIYTSTGAVYGEPIQKESLEKNPLKPNTFYGLTKMMGESVVRYYADNYKIKYVILRFPNVYGEGNKKGVVYNFVSDIKSKKKISIFGDGKQSRNFLHVSDAVEAIKKSIAYNKSNIFNISNPQKTSINDLVGILREKYDFEVEYKDANNNLKDLLLNINKAERELKFLPKIIKIKI